MCNCPLAQAAPSSRPLDQLHCDHRLDLSDRHLARALPDYLVQLHMAGKLLALRQISFRSDVLVRATAFIAHISADNGITDDVLNRPFGNGAAVDGGGKPLDMARFILQHAASLEEIDLSGNCITGTGLSNLLHALK